MDSDASFPKIVGDAFGAELGAREDADVACYAGGLAQEHMAAMDQYSQSAYQYGKNVAKLAVFPIGEEQKRLKSCKYNTFSLIRMSNNTFACRGYHTKSSWKYSRDYSSRFP